MKEVWSIETSATLLWWKMCIIQAELNHHYHRCENHKS